MSEPVRTVTDGERRARLGLRHALGERVPDPVAAAAAVVCLHATELASVYLSAWARSGASRADVDRCLYADRTIVRQLAMRRTVFAFPRDLLPAVRGSAAARVARQQAAQLARGVVAAGLATDGAAWVDQACADALALLRNTPATTRQLRAQLPALGERLPPPEQAGAAPVPVAPRILTVLAAGGGVVRGANDGGWKRSRPYWTPTETWLGSAVRPLPEAEGYAELVSRWLWAFGPGTTADITWWLGATKTAVRRALADVGAVAVSLDDGSPAWLHPDDAAEIGSAAPWAALLPALDPTTMGWRDRNFYIDQPTAAVVYDRAGNGKPTAWWQGRIVGQWAQRNDGTVIVVPAVPLTASAAAALKHQAAQLTAWLDGDVIRSAFQSPRAPGEHGEIIL
ncbi:MAG TPA: winged helix DNA-binding domain-containing protein [Streptosporangiaceae bacterium]|jgi:hypothetical protein